MENCLGLNNKTLYCGKVNTIDSSPCSTCKYCSHMYDFGLLVCNYNKPKKSKPVCIKTTTRKLLIVNNEET
jgi:hypothetical protein